MPSPPSSVSLPARPSSRSLPAPPVITLALASPSSVSLWSLPVRFSMLLKLSPLASPTATTRLLVRLAVIALAA